MAWGPSRSRFVGFCHIPAAWAIPMVCHSDSASKKPKSSWRYCLHDERPTEQSIVLIGNLLTTDPSYFASITQARNDDCSDQLPLRCAGYPATRLAAFYPIPENNLPGWPGCKHRWETADREWGLV